MHDTFKPTLRQRIRLFFEGQVTYAFAPTVPTITFYGGATITAAHDGAGHEWCVCCGKDNQSGRFGLYGMKDDYPVLIRPVSGRGSLWISLIDGKGRWIGFEGSTRMSGDLPGFVPVPLGGGYTVAPKGTVRVFVDTNGFDGQQTVNLASFGIPPCQALNVRLALDADAGRVFRCGPPTDDPNLQTSAMLTVTGLGPAARAYESGIVSVTASRTLLIMTENGPIAAGYVDVTGWWA